MGCCTSKLPYGNAYAPRPVYRAEYGYQPDPHPAVARRTMEEGRKKEEMEECRNYWCYRLE
jgi:hypothetical protein